MASLKIWDNSNLEQNIFETFVTYTCFFCAIDNILFLASFLLHHGKCWQITVTVVQSVNTLHRFEIYFRGI